MIHPHDLAVAQLRATGLLNQTDETFSSEVDGVLMVWNISHAKEITQNRRPVELVHIPSMRESIYPTGTWPLPEEGYEVDPAHAMRLTTDEALQPVILAFSDRYGMPDGFLIDGWHRVWRALCDSRTWLLGVRLEEPEWLDCLIIPHRSILDDLAARHKREIDALATEVKLIRQERRTALAPVYLAHHMVPEMQPD